MTALLASFFLVAVAEMADKTQLLTLSLACRYRPRSVFIGVTLAIMVLNAVAVGVGALLGAVLPVLPLKIGAGCLFIAFGIWTLLERERPAEEECAPRSGRVEVFAAMGAFLLAEIGDKTQLATLSLAARYDEYLAVWAGATLGMVLANGAAVAVAMLAGRKLPERLLKRVSALLFLGFGVWTIVEAAL
jgi:putative Ca2+/H+ antiporter (TMEM165/GDT1 family)